MNIINTTMNIINLVVNSFNTRFGNTPIVNHKRIEWVLRHSTESVYSENAEELDK